MANVLTAVTPKLLAQGLLALREHAITVRNVNRTYESMAGTKGSTIDVPIPSAISVQQVSPSNTPPNTADVAPTSIPIPMDQWWEAPFYLTDTDIRTAMDGTIPMQASEAIKAIGNKVDTHLLSLYKKFYGYTGTAGTTPFAGANPVTDVTATRKLLEIQLAPTQDRSFMLNPDAEASLLNAQAFHNANYNGNDPTTIRTGQIGTRFGFDWYMNQNMPTHTAGTASSATVTTAVSNAAGATSVNLKVAASTATVVEGDIISFAGHNQTYVVTDTTVTLTTGGVTVNILPALKVAVDGSVTPVAVTVRASHVVNLALHRDAIAFASRPFLDVQAEGLGSIIQSAVDPVSGLTLRLEITREHKRTRFSYDMLWGAAVIRREFGARLAG